MGEDEPADDELPSDVVEESIRLTRLARDAVDEREARAYRQRRDERLAEFDYEARVRNEDTRDVLVLYPGEWLEGDVVRFERIEDTDRAVERLLDGPGEESDWEAVEAHNREVVRQVRDEHGEVHGANADAFADFMGNHCVRPMDSATAAEVEEFLSEYFVRNAWPTAAQKAVVQESIRLVFETVDEPVPSFSNCSRRAR